MKLVQSLQATTWLSKFPLHLRRFRLQTLVAIDLESRQTLFPSFCGPPSEVAVLFDRNLGIRPIPGQVVNLDLLLCTGFDSQRVDLFPCLILTQRPMSDRKIERRNERCFDR